MKLLRDQLLKLQIVKLFIHQHHIRLLKQLLNTTTPRRPIPLLNIPLQPNRMDSLNLNTILLSKTLVQQGKIRIFFDKTF